MKTRQERVAEQRALAQAHQHQAQMLYVMGLPLHAVAHQQAAHDAVEQANAIQKGRR